MIMANRPTLKNVLKTRCYMKSYRKKFFTNCVKS